MSVTLCLYPYRGICMMRKHLGTPEDLDVMPSYLGHIFRLSYYGSDNFDYGKYLKSGSTDEERDASWKKCRDHMGMYMTPDPDYEREHRQQYTRHHLP